MRKIVLLSLIVLIFAQTYASGDTVKRADLAGTWYLSSKEELSIALDGYLAAAKIEPIYGDIKALIVPHAGLVYSGPVAGYAYKAVQGKDYSAVLLLGFCHRKQFDGVSVYKEGSFETPLGPIEIDAELAQDIISRSEIMSYLPGVFDDENSVELQLPFIKKVLPKTKIVPMAFGSGEFIAAQKTAKIIADILKERDDVLLVASTDMSHYLSYDAARKVDLASLELLKNFDAKEIHQRAVMGEQLFCGYMPVATALLMAKEIDADGIAVLKYANSGDVTGDRRKVVGYASVAIYDKGGGKREVKMEKTMLNASRRKRLLEIARDTISTYLSTGKAPALEETDDIFNREMGAFVTLHKNGQLRGCIGNMIGKGPLYLTVRDMAIQSATGDPRFPKVTSAELGQIDIEVSVLSELEKVTDVNKIEMGTHGVIVRKGFASGVFLPQVAIETGWSRDEFMSNLCSGKAGLAPDAWKKGDIDIFIFTAEVFGEKGTEQ
ncbi:MAG: AmmeMemoRadiSam system protein B [Candidatus Omnitrophica bacterium]|nr:AmmeMemoRadiSam system protein B [Candidatus Omnitrophota bacterium]